MTKKWFMKLPRISSPTTYKIDDIEITTASAFDLLSTTGQWVVVLVAVVPMVVLVAYLVTCL